MASNMSPKDADQVLRSVMDDVNNRLKVDAVISPDGHDLEIDHTDDSIAIGTPTALFTSTSASGGKVALDVNIVNGPEEVEVTNFPAAFGISGTLPSFASTPTVNLGTIGLSATAANQITEIANLATIASNTTNASTPVVTGSVSVTNFPATQPISATSLPLPTNAATSANQATANSSLSTIVSNTTANMRSNILTATDMIETFTWADFGLSTQRVTSIVYSSSIYTPHTATKTFAYTLVSGAYRLDSVSWVTT